MIMLTAPADGASDEDASNREGEAEFLETPLSTPLIKFECAKSFLRE